MPPPLPVMAIRSPSWIHAAASSAVTSITQVCKSGFSFIHSPESYVRLRFCQSPKIYALGGLRSVPSRGVSHDVRVADAVVRPCERVDGLHVFRIEREVHHVEIRGHV